MTLATFGKVCLNRFNFVEVNYDFLSTASRLGACIWQAWSKSSWIFCLFGKYAIVLSLVFRCHTQFERHGLWGSVWDGRNERFWGLQLLRH